jgi:hypothetical protein
MNKICGQLFTMPVKNSTTSCGENNLLCGLQLALLNIEFMLIHLDKKQACFEDQPEY